jgi:hypothetical protein
MMEFHAVCRLCHRDFFKVEDVVSFGLRDGKLYPVSLEGRDSPWAGIRCVCVGCADTIADQIRPLPANLDHIPMWGNASETSQDVPGSVRIDSPDT